MLDQIVSVRMPVSLVNELKNISEKNHFLDVSEAIRSIIRERWTEYQDPYSVRLEEIRKKVVKATVPSKITALKKDLKKLLESLNEIQ